MLDILSKIMNSFGAAIVVPFVIYIIAIIMKVTPKKAFNVDCTPKVGHPTE